MDDRIMMGHDRVENLRECIGRLANKRTKIAERTEETSAVTGRDLREDRRRKDGFWCGERQTTRKLSGHDIFELFISTNSTLLP